MKKNVAGILNRIDTIKVVTLMIPFDNYHQYKVVQFIRDTRHNDWYIKYVKFYNANNNLIGEDSLSGIISRSIVIDEISRALALINSGESAYAIVAFEDGSVIDTRSEEDATNTVEPADTPESIAELNQHINNLEHQIEEMRSQMMGMLNTIMSNVCK